MLSDHNGIKLDINNTKITGKLQNTCRLNKAHLTSTWIKEEI